MVYDYNFDSLGPRLSDSQLRDADRGRDRQGPQVPDLRHHRPRDTDPSKISLVSEITGTPPNSCGPGCGGTFILRAHKGWWSQRDGLLLRGVGRAGFPQRRHPDLRSEEPEGAEVRRPRVAARAERRRARLRRAVLASPDRGRSEQAALRRLPQRRGQAAASTSPIRRSRSWCGRST